MRIVPRFGLTVATHVPLLWPVCATILAHELKEVLPCLTSLELSRIRFEWQDAGAQRGIHEQEHP
jgi:hypothetical protein